MFLTSEIIQHTLKFVLFYDKECNNRSKNICIYCNKSNKITSDNYNNHYFCLHCINNINDAQDLKYDSQILHNINNTIIQ
jgi:hypothetical protein